MRRWNGWGDNSVEYPLPDNAAGFLEEIAGSGKPPKDVGLQEILAAMPPSRLPDHPLISTDPRDRLCYSRGQSLPDWIALRSGKISTFCDGVAWPTTAEELKKLINFAAGSGINLIPYGGGTSVTGHINPIDNNQPNLTVSMRRMNRLQHFDEQSQLANFEAGISGPELETQLRAIGYTLGHFPQSFELSTLGGWIATRSSGQQSLGYGRIEDLFAGGKVITPAGTLDLPPHPASAAGPDLRQLILGSEGRMGFISEAIVRASRLPEKEDFHAIFFPDFQQGETAVRQIIQAKLPLSMLRLSTAVETETTLALAGHEKLLGLLQQALSLRGVSENKAMLLAGFSSTERIVNAARKEVLNIAHHNGGIHVGKQFGRQWHKGRFQTPYLRNTLWDMGYAIDTLETAVSWDKVTRLIADIESALKDCLKSLDERVHVFSHLSHLYEDGASIYTTYLFRIADDPNETLHRWQMLKSAASLVIVNTQATISHQHGIGQDHIPYMQAEKGELGMELINDVIRRFDPRGIMNPGKLIA